MSETWAMPAGSGDGWPDDYERGRPGWPEAAVDVAGLDPGATVLDLGAGTGKLTRVLSRRFERVLAVEPADPMRRVLERMCPGVEIVAGSGQQIPLADASMDAVFAAQAFHWFGDERALAEIVRVLRPGGALVLLWNLPGGPTEPSVQAVEDLLRPHVPSGELGYDPLDLGGPPAASGDWRAVFEPTPFEPLCEARIPNLQVLDREGVVAFFASMGWLADLPDHARLPLLDEVRSRLDGSEYRRLWETHVYWTRLGPA